MSENPPRVGSADAMLARLVVISSLATTVLAALLWMGPAIWRVDLFDDDAAHHVFWLYQYVDGSLFPGDVALRYLRTSAPLGYQYLYQVIAPVFDPLAATEWLAVGLLGVTCWLSWRLATAIDGPDREVRGLLAVLGVVLLIAYGQATGGILPPMAFQRSFALPLVLLCLWGLVSRRYWLVGVSWLGAGLFYPVMLPLLGITGGLLFASETVRWRRMPDAWLPNGVLGMLALGAALFGMPRADDLGPAATYEQAMAMPEFGPGGRLVMYAPGLINNLLRFHMTGIGWSPYVLALIVIAVALAASTGLRRLIPAAAWVMLGVGLALWLAMRLFPEHLMFGLYLPNRHSRWAVAAFGVVAIPAGTYVFGAWLHKQWIGRRPDDVLGPARTLAILVPVLVVLLLAPGAVARLRTPVDHGLEETYAFIRQLPKDTLVAAHPDLANFIPLRARRSVLTSTEVSMPWLLGYYAQMKPRLEASLRAAYATDIEQVDRELAPYGVDVFVSGPAAWQRRGYLQPFDSMVKSLQDEGKEAGFALQRPPPDRILFQSGDYVVIRVDKP